ncbi:bifunctional (p)ppGpp synthetase/guanosine-3',5'-bis(diphosphate) 3'-pyrophosphohydrolase [Candidatus Nomurabacteria bacterium]|nr:bifunctional (p)ppGpp synthetase/guanosine-3',5'-bis(diphosphate) 3'-pyrophosphohydrolase [Candidatus Nomurabacteria bacterium]
MYTYKIEQAIKAASLLHQEQLRKGDVPLPYATHLMSVMMIVRDYTNDEDTLVAALLHDTLEDTDYTYEELVDDFGEKVAEIVRTVSEPQSTALDRMPWIEVKKTYAKQLRRGPKEAVLVAAADKIHNFRSVIDEYYDNHNGFLRDFGTNLDNKLEAYQNIANAINSRLSDGIVHEFNHTFKAYKEFIFNVKDSLS